MKPKRKVNLRREELKKLSAKAHVIKRTNPNYFGCSINFILINHFYGGIGHDYKTWCGWDEIGYRVKKGEKGVAIWGKRLNYENDTGDDLDFYPMCFLFGCLQVEEKNHICP